MCSQCTIRKRGAEHQDARSCQPSAKRRKIHPKASQDLNYSLDLVIANARDDTEIGRAFQGPHPQHFPTFSSQAKELSPPYSPERLLKPAPIKHSTSDASTQVDLQGSSINNVALIVPKMEDNESFDGIPLGDEDTNDFAPPKRFPCSICRKTVISNPYSTTCTNCVSELPGKLQFASKNGSLRPGSSLSNPIKLEEMQDGESAQLSQFGVEQDLQYSRGVRSTIKVKRQHDSINSDPYEHIDQIRNTVAIKVHSWQQNVKPGNPGSSLDEPKTRASWSEGRRNLDRDERAIQENQLHDRLRKSNTEVEDLKVNVRNLTAQLDAAKKKYERTLREKKDELLNAKKNSEQDRRDGQKHIARLKDELRALRDKQKSSDLTTAAPERAAYCQKDYDQLKAEFHALRKEKSMWDAEKLDLKRRVKQFGDTLGNLEGMKDSHTKLIKKLRRENERLKNKVRNPEAEQENRSEQEGLVAEYERLNADNVNLQQEIAKLREELANKEQDQPMQEIILNAHANHSQPRRRSSSPIPDITDFTPILHQDLLSKRWPLLPVDKAAKKSEIASRQRIKELAGPFSQQTHKERGKDVHHTKSISWLGRGALHDDDDVASSNGSSSSGSTRRRMVEVRVPSRFSSEERSMYDEQSFDSDGDHQMADTTHKDLPSHTQKKRLRPSSHKSLHPRHYERKETAFVIPDDDDDDNSSHLSEPSASSSSGMHDPIDLETRGAPLKSSSARLETRATNSSSKKHAAGQDSDVSPPPPITRNERSMASLLRATGLSSKEMRPAIRNGKLCMEEGSGDEGQGRIRRARRKTAWPVVE